MFELVQYWCLPEKALNQKRRIFAVFKWTALPVSRVVSLHIGCRQPIYVIRVISVGSVINFWVTWNDCLEEFLGWFLIDRKFCVVHTEMNCSLKSDRQKCNSHDCVHIEMLQIIHRTETTSLFQNREDLLYVRHVVCWHMETVWPYSVTAFGFWVSWIDEFPRTYWIFREIQVFLVHFCRDEFPRTFIQNCIFLPLLGTRRCVLIEFSCVRSLCTCPIILTWCLEYPGLLDIIGLCTVLELVETSEARLNVGFDFATILSSPFCSCILFRHRSGAASQDEILSAAK